MPVETFKLFPTTNDVEFVLPTDPFGARSAPAGVVLVHIRADGEVGRPEATRTAPVNEREGLNRVLREAADQVGHRPYSERGRCLQHTVCPWGRHD